MSMCRVVYWGAVFLMTAGPSAPLAPAQSNSTLVKVTQEQDSVVVKTATDTLRLTVCGPTVVHVVSSPDGSATKCHAQAAVDR
jgi:hypothetical protein